MISNEEIEIVKSLVFRSQIEEETGKIILIVDTEDLSKETLSHILLYLINNSSEANGLFHSYIQEAAKKVNSFFEEHGLDVPEKFQNLDLSSLDKEVLDLFKKLQLISSDGN